MYNVLTNLQEYYETEIKILQQTKERKEVSTLQKNYAIQRCLGASFYAQRLGADFDKIDKLYTKCKKTIDNI